MSGVINANGREGEGDIGDDVRVELIDVVVGISMDVRRHCVLRRRENDAARRFNSNCEHTTLSNVKEFFPFVDEFDIMALIRCEFGIVPRRAP